MTKKFGSYIICILAISNLVSCSSFIYTETNSQSSTEKTVTESSIRMPDILSETKCTLVSIKISDYKKLSFPLNGNNSTLQFSNNGSYNGKAICNTFFGQYTLERNNLRFTTGPMTRVNCDNETENLIIKTLGEINNYTIDEKMLFLKRNAEILMVYKLN